MVIQKNEWKPRGGEATEWFSRVFLDNHSSLEWILPSARANLHIFPLFYPSRFSYKDMSCAKILHKTWPWQKHSHPLGAGQAAEGECQHQERVGEQVGWRRGAPRRPTSFRSNTAQKHEHDVIVKATPPPQGNSVGCRLWLSWLKFGEFPELVERPKYESTNPGTTESLYRIAL